jgi:hypothetical protein
MSWQMLFFSITSVGLLTAAHYSAVTGRDDKSEAPVAARRQRTTSERNYVSLRSSCYELTERLSLLWVGPIITAATMPIKIVIPFGLPRKGRFTPKHSR